MAYHGQARDPAQHHAFALAAKVSRAEPRGEYLAVHTRQLAVQPGFQIIRRYRRPVLRGLEQPHRSAVENHVHRATQMGSWVLINAGWYKPRALRKRNDDAPATFAPWEGVRLTRLYVLLLRHG